MTILQTIGASTLQLGEDKQASPHLQLREEVEQYLMGAKPKTKILVGAVLEQKNSLTLRKWASKYAERPK